MLKVTFNSKKAMQYFDRVSNRLGSYATTGTTEAGFFLKEKINRKIGRDSYEVMTNEGLMTTWVAPKPQDIKDPATRGKATSIWRYKKCPFWKGLTRNTPLEGLFTFGNKKSKTSSTYGIRTGTFPGGKKLIALGAKVGRKGTLQGRGGWMSDTPENRARLQRIINKREGVESGEDIIISIIQTNIISIGLTVKRAIERYLKV